MKIFLPFLSNKDSFINEIENFHTESFIYGDLKDYLPSYPIVMIHWPEAIFKWKPPTNGNLLDLEKSIDLWKKYSKVVYVRHNYNPHSSTNLNFERLYHLVETSADAIVHLGENSYREFKVKYPNKLQKIVFHPTYNSITNTVSREQAKKYFKIPSNTKVILVFGKLRDDWERNLIFKLRKDFSARSITILVSNFSFGSKIKNKFIRKGLIKIKSLYFNYLKGVNINYAFISTDDIQYYFNASDIVLVLRRNNLNSGLPFMARRFNKVVVCPNIGNISEYANRHKLPLYNIDDYTSVQKAIDEGIALSETQSISRKYNLTNSDYDPKNIYEEYMNLFNELYEG